jgi:secretion/DNA translocation related TadE-like protein
VNRAGPAHGAETGAGTALVVGVVAAIVAGIIAVLAVTASASAAGQAATAADLSALAAADAARGLTGGDPCAVAARTAERNGADLAGCVRSGAGGHVVEVRTEVAFGPSWDWLPTGLRASGRARAGPPPMPWSPGGTG